MTNAEKFKEVFGFELNTKTDYYCPFNSTKCDNLPCDACIETFWQSEYKEPKQGTVSEERQKWVKAIENIKEEIQKAHNEVRVLSIRAKLISNFFAEEEIERVEKMLDDFDDLIDEHTKELMQ